MLNINTFVRVRAMGKITFPCLYILQATVL